MQMPVWAWRVGELVVSVVKTSQTLNPLFLLNYRHNASNLYKYFTKL
jgi:hypothetical protein